MNKINLSYTSIFGQYMKCPKMFKLHKIDGIYPSEDETASLIGKAVHEFIENGADQSVLLTPKMQKYIPVILQAWDIITNIPKEMIEISKKMEQKEAFFSLKYDEFGINVIGYIDGIGKINDEITLVDYKTGNSYDENQLKLYALATFKSMPNAERIRTMYLLLKSGKTVTNVVTRKEAQEFEETLKFILKQIRSSMDNNSFPAVPGNQCRYCPFKELKKPDGSYYCQEFHDWVSKLPPGDWHTKPPEDLIAMAKETEEKIMMLEGLLAEIKKRIPQSMLNERVITYIDASEVSKDAILYLHEKGLIKVKTESIKEEPVADEIKKAARQFVEYVLP